jgi:hypothetical protein
VSNLITSDFKGKKQSGKVVTASASNNPSKADASIQLANLNRLRNDTDADTDDEKEEASDDVEQVAGSTGTDATGLLSQIGQMITDNRSSAPEEKTSKKSGRRMTAKNFKLQQVLEKRADPEAGSDSEAELRKEDASKAGLVDAAGGTFVGKNISMVFVDEAPADKTESSSTEVRQNPKKAKWLQTSDGDSVIATALKRAESEAGSDSEAEKEEESKEQVAGSTGDDVFATSFFGNIHHHRHQG